MKMVHTFTIFYFMLTLSLTQLDNQSIHDIDGTKEYNHRKNAGNN